MDSDRTTPRRTNITITRTDGSTWRLAKPMLTSDGFLLATGVLIDPDTGDELRDSEGFPVIHSFFVGYGGERVDG